MSIRPQLCLAIIYAVTMSYYRGKGGKVLGEGRGAGRLDSVEGPGDGVYHGQGGKVVRGDVVVDDRTLWMDKRMTLYGWHEMSVLLAGEKRGQGRV